MAYHFEKITIGCKELTMDSGNFLSVTISIENGTCIAYNERFGVYGMGNNTELALCDFKQSFVEFFENIINCSNTSLGESAKKFKDSLLSFATLRIIKKEKDTMDFTERFEPKTFAEFFPVAKNLDNLVTAMRCGTLHKKILISGPTGCGKTTLARLIASGVNCSNAQPPCGECDDCKEARSPVSFDVHLVDCTFRGMKNIDELKTTLRYVTVKLNHRVVIIDEIQCLINNEQLRLISLLDTASCYLVLCTTDPNRMNQALLNRCTHISVSPLSSRNARVAARQILEKGGYTGDIESGVDILEHSSNGVPRRILIEAQALYVSTGDDKITRGV